MKSIRRACLALIVCATIPLPANATDDVKLPADRAGSLLNAFQVMCTLKAADFDHLSAQAGAMRMKPLGDETTTAPTGETVRNKAWLGMLSTGPFKLGVEQMSGAKGVATSCAVDGTVPDLDAFRDSVIKALRLNASQNPQTIEGSRVYYWDDYAGNGDTLVLRDMDRPSGHFVQLKLIRMAKANTP